MLPFQDKNGMKALDKTISFLASQIESLDLNLQTWLRLSLTGRLNYSHPLGIGNTGYNMIVATGGFSISTMQAGFPFYRDMPDLPAVRNIRTHQRWD